MTEQLATTSSFSEVIRARRSPREFQPDPMPLEAIEGVLEDAQTAPSNSNTQPWEVHVVSGAKRDELSAALLAAHDEQRPSLDFTATYGDGVHLERSQVFGAALYGSLGIARHDCKGREEFARNNLKFFGAPHVALLFMPQLGDGVRTAGDIGMYAQNFLLSLTARGYQGIPQTMIGMYADPARKVLGVPDDRKLLFGISFGTATPDSPLRSVNPPRLPLRDSVVLHDTPLW